MPFPCVERLNLDHCHEITIVLYQQTIKCTTDISFHSETDVTDLVSKQVLLKTTPVGNPTAEHFMMKEAPVKAPEDGEILCKNLYLSLDPYMRSQIAGRHISGKIDEGDLLKGETISEVLESRHPDFKAGDIITVRGDWQTYCTVEPIMDTSRFDHTRKLDTRIPHLTLALGSLGMPGMTAYAGVKHLAEPKAGDVLVVSAAAGAVGSMVGQYAKSLGCKVIGIAGSDDKCTWLKSEAGFDDCINYKTEKVADGIDRLCPDGVDIYFDNVGGETLDAVIWRLAIGARVVLCGMISVINQTGVPTGPGLGSVIKARATVRGLVVYDFIGEMSDMVDTFLPLIDDGKIKFLEDVSEGIEAAPEAFSRLMAGKNHGKTIVKLA